MNRISRTNNNVKVTGKIIIPKNPRSRPPRNIEQALMKRMGIKPVLVYWQLNREYDASDILSKLLLINHSLVVDIKKELLWTAENAIRNEAKLIDKEKGEKTLAQYLASLVMKCAPLLTNIDPSDKEKTADTRSAYRKAMLILLDQDIRIRQPGFIQSIIRPRIKGYLAPIFPKLKSITDPADFIDQLTAKELVMTFHILRLISSDMKTGGMNIAFKNAVVRDMPQAPDIYAIIKDKEVMINKQELSNITVFDPAEAKKRIMIRQGVPI